MDKISGLGVALILLLTSLEVYSLHKLLKELKRKSEEKTEARREALRPAAQKKVHDEWTRYRNRRDLWDYLSKE